jgi:hypothetical protein
VGEFVVLFGPWVEVSPSVLKSTPEEAVVSLEVIVLFTISMFKASRRDTPAPSPSGYVVGDDDTIPPAWIGGEAHHVGAIDVLDGNAAATSSVRGVTHDEVGVDGEQRTVPSLGPVVPGAEQSTLFLGVHGESASAAPIMSSPPPLVGVVGLVLWLNRNELCSMSPL